MTNDEIKHYLAKDNYEVYGSDFILDVMNTSPQICDLDFDFDTQIAIVQAKDGTKFKFKWLLHEL